MTQDDFKRFFYGEWNSLIDDAKESLRKELDKVGIQEYEAKTTGKQVKEEW